VSMRDGNDVCLILAAEPICDMLACVDNMDNLNDMVSAGDILRIMAFVLKVTHSKCILRLLSACQIKPAKRDRELITKQRPTF
ncbi:MAG: hypothetical protein AAFW82_09990, partial [Pseudomonadota bacterium]